MIVKVIKMKNSKILLFGSKFDTIINPYYIQYIISQQKNKKINNIFILI